MSDPLTDIPGKTPNLDAFRAEPAKVEIHVIERMLIWILAFHLCLMPWCLGGTPIWSQFLSALLSVAEISLALLPRKYRANQLFPEAVTLNTYPKLLKFPFFWGGLALILYILLQSINPAFAYATDGRVWWIHPIAYLHWLPTSVQSPFERMNAWRTNLIYASAWLTGCAVWVGFTRRRSLQALFMSLIFNGCLLSLVGIAQKVHGYGKILGFIKPVAGSYFSTFLYKNHAGAYLNLILGLSAALGLWYFRRGERRLEKSTPAGFFGFCSAFVGIAIALSDSRAATLIMIGFLLCALFYFLTIAIKDKTPGKNPILIGSSVCVFFAFLLFSGFSLKLERTISRFNDLRNADRQTSVDYRLTAASAAWDMAHDRIVTGWGAGSFRFCFPIYQAKHPSIMTAQGMGRIFWEHAHNDYAEFVGEIGLVGTFILIVVCAFWIVQVVRLFFWENSLGLLILIALLGTLAHAWMDFPFHNPAILSLWVTIFVSCPKWLEFEQRTFARA